MPSNLLKALEQAEKRFSELSESMADPEIVSDRNRYRQLAKEHSDLGEMIRLGREYRGILRKIEENDELLQSSEDPELEEMARAEAEELEENLNKVRSELEMLLLPSDPDDHKNAIVEIRAGTGGEEAALFAADLYRMYSRYIEARGWRIDVMNTSGTGIGGLKEIIFAVEGKGAYGEFRLESGVHRVQRVPRTEASGRLHTSAASVAVLPEAEEIDLRIDPQDLKVDVYRSSGPGGQSVNTTDSAVRITHLPTNTVVT